MKLCTSRVTAQGQVSVPAEIRRRLGLGPGTVLEWEIQDDAVIVRRAGRFSSLDVHQALFGLAPDRRSFKELKQGIADRMKRRHARG